ncbi:MULTISPECIES: LysE/ArgO family amino acid transporter [unclassified Endozoicomonas]|uniref:LysE/ArgO family amino acid transporter n=1 Tax=unclassified Endozoicomonas TaxID=2644528 RepID=UPI0021488258|nr:MULTISPECIES: LysE/ArgO family amino acid transporter [unclassified Endozoicomonas]
MLEIYLNGMLLSGGLIIAIGSQNAFLLAHGLRRESPVLIATLCAVCDALLILAGVMGLGTLIQSSNTLLELARWAGVVYLTGFGLISLRRSFKTEQLKAEGQVQKSVRAIVLSTLAVTLLNPHVYLDTVILLGSIGAQYGEQRGYFVLGAVTASLIWFYGLGFGAVKLAPLLSRPLAWKIIDLVICLIMFSMALSLVQMDLVHIL